MMAATRGWLAAVFAMAAREVLFQLARAEVKISDQSSFETTCLSFSLTRVRTRNKFGPQIQRGPHQVRRRPERGSRGACAQLRGAPEKSGDTGSIKLNLSLLACTSANLGSARVSSLPGKASASS